MKSIKFSKGSSPKLHFHKGSRDIIIDLLEISTEIKNPNIKVRVDNCFEIAYLLYFS